MSRTKPVYRIGEFIAEKLAIEKEQLAKIINMQKYLHEKIGEIAIHSKFIKKDDLEIILEYQKEHQTNFGVAAIALGLLKNIQVKYLLDIQTREERRIGELLVEEGVIKQDEFFKILDEFFSKKERKFTILTFVGDALQKGIMQEIEPYHYELKTCSTEEELFQQIQKLNPQLIFLDQAKKNIYELSLEINQKISSKPVKIAVFTPDRQELKILTAYEYGIDYILPVPFNPKHLINILIDTENKNAEKRKERILVVDDSAIVRDSIAQELSESGFQVIFAENGKEALEIAELERPDLITMDINMPVMDGYQACSALKRHPFLSKIPIIILTINNSWEEREKGFDVGAVEYFTKPFSKGHLSSYIEYLLSGGGKERQEKILIAEDDPIHRNIYETILTKNGFYFKIEENGAKIFEALENGFAPSIILLDLSMPVMNGLEACEKLKEDSEYKQIPVIMITVSKDKEDILKGLKAGAEDYIIKPFDEDEFVARIEAHLKNYTLLKSMQKKTELIQLLQEITVTANEASTVEDAIRVSMEKICTYTGWPIGHASLTGQEERSGNLALWYVDPSENYKKFRKSIINSSFNPGEGLVGQVLTSGKPVLIEDVTRFTSFPSEKLTRDFGLKTRFAFPILEGKKVAAVLEFFSDKLKEPDAGLLESISYLATQLGRVTERKRAEEQVKASLKEKEVLLREIHHRVKNNMQVISSLLRLQAQHTKDKKTLEMFRDCQNRITSMSFVHENLYQSDDLAKIDFSEYIRTIANGLFKSYRMHADKVELKLKVEDIFLGIDTAIPCGLIINELLSNSLKYAFKKNRKGKIKITLKEVADKKTASKAKVKRRRQKAKMIELIIGDNGSGLPEKLDFRNTETLGLQLVTTLAEGQLHGKVELNREKGTEFTIRFKELMHKKRW